MKLTSFIGTEIPKPLEKEVLYEYFEKKNNGDKNARNEIIKHNIRIVIHEVIKRFSNTSYDLQELVSVGLVGLLKSVDTFDLSKGIEFSTYSTKCITNEILAFLRKSKKNINDISLEQPFKDKLGNDSKLEDMLIDINSNFMLDYENNESYKIIREIVSKLPAREKYIIINYFGFIDNKTMTQREIADKLGLLQPMISKIIKKTLNDIRFELENIEIIEKLSNKESKTKIIKTKL